MAQQTSYKSKQFSQISERLRNPFPGLRPFGIDEAHLFFGREGQCDDVLYRLAENHFTAILGFSGSGKSSLIYCGLVPILHGGFMTSAGSDWRIVVMRPGTSPIDNLAQAFVEKEDGYEGYSEEERMVRRTVLSTILRSSSLGLVDLTKREHRPEENILVVVDQFEEVFRYRRLGGRGGDYVDESALFVSLLVEAVRRHNLPIYVTLTMRSDFIGDCAVFTELTQMINDSHYLVPQMGREQKRRAIEGPVSVGGGKIAPRLSQQLLNDVGDNPDQLPILQHALMRTWQYWQESGNPNEPLDLHHYTAIGTLREALSLHANEAYDSLTSREQRVCEGMFKVLTEKGVSAQMIRRPTKLSVIAGIVGVSEEEVIRVIDRFRAPGRSLLMPSHEVSLHSDMVIDISHESLMRIWARLRTWIEEEAKSREMYLKLTEASERYQQGMTGLYKMPDLQLALNWKEDNKPTMLWGKRHHPAYERTMMFLETSRRAYENEQHHNERLHRRKIRNARVGALAVGVGLLAALFLAYLSNEKANEATYQRELAEEASIVAQQQEQLANAERVKAEAALRSAEEAKALALAQEQEAKRQASLAEIARQQAQQREQDALLAEKRAEDALIIAEKRKEEAERQTEKARQANARADNLYYQALAQGMGTKVEALRDKELKSLVAYQAHLFYSEYGDRSYNADIYGGVYDAYKASEGEEINHRMVHEGNVRTVTTGRYDGKDVVYSGSSDGKVYVWDAIGQSDAQQRLLLDLSNEDAVVRVLQVFANGRRLLVAGALGVDNRAYILDTGDLGILRALSIPSQVVYDVEILPGEKEYVFVGSNRIIFKGSLEADNRFEALYSSEAQIEDISLHTDGLLLSFGDERGQVQQLDLRTGEVLALYRTENEEPVNALSYSPDGSMLAFGSHSGKLFLWDVKVGGLITDLNAHYSRIDDIRFSEDQRLMVTSGWDRRVNIWDMENINDLPISLKDHGDWVWSSTFSSDGSQVITASSDKLLRVYPTQVDNMVSNLCARAGRNFTEKEWKQYVGSDEPYAVTCASFPTGEDK